MALVLVVTAAWTALVLAAALQTRHRAAAAADLAALAAAGSGGLAAATAPDCGRAAAVARANGGRLRACRVVGEVVEVQVSMPLPPLARMLDEPVRRARAGPSTPPSSGLVP